MNSNLDKNAIDIDFYGNIAAGKTQLAAAISRHVTGSNRDSNKDFSDQLEVIADGNPGFRSEFTENFSMKVDNIRLNFNIHRGEVLRIGSKASNRPLFSDYGPTKNRIFLAVVNPFTLDRDIAFQASCAMIAWLQRSSVTMEHAIRITFAQLFNMTDFDDNSTAFIRLLSPNHADKIIFFHDSSESHGLHYRVGNRSQSFEYGEPILTSSLGQDLRIAVDGIVDKNINGHSQLSDVLEKTEHSMLVLSHLDLMKYMVGFDVGNFDKACDLLYRNGDRTKGVQLFGRYISTTFRWEVIERTTEGTNITYYKKGSINFRSDTPDFPNVVIRNLLHLIYRKKIELIQRKNWLKIFYITCGMLFLTISELALMLIASDIKIFFSVLNIVTILLVCGNASIVMLVTRKLAS